MADEPIDYFFNSDEPIDDYASCVGFVCTLDGICSSIYAEKLPDVPLACSLAIELGKHSWLHL